MNDDMIILFININLKVIVIIQKFYILNKFLNTNLNKMKLNVMKNILIEIK